jgi:hypothetical protein
MTATPREIVRQTLRFEHPARVPRNLWVLPWAGDRYPDQLRAINERHPSDFGGVPGVYKPSPRVRGDMFAAGLYTDEWGCVFENLQPGIIGEVREPILAEIGDWRAVRPPYEILPEDRAAARDTVNRACAQSDLFMMAACCPRPWERYQFLRGSANSMMDILFPESGAGELLRAIHEYYLRELEFWVTTDVDMVMFMDDWGSQNSLLIDPEIWRALFKPLYRDYCELAHAHGKSIFMHSDGHILAIYPDLIEVGVDAVNSQLFVMDLEELARVARGRIAFWGEIDRQHALVDPDPEAARRAVRHVARHLYDPAGGVIAQCEFGPGGRPENVMAVFDEWEAVQREAAGAGAFRQ